MMTRNETEARRARRKAQTIEDRAAERRQAQTAQVAPTGAPTVADVRAHLFGSERLTSNYVVQSYYFPVNHNVPVRWRSRGARTLAGARRIVLSRGIVKGLRRPALIVTLQLTEVSTTEWTP